MVKRTKSNPGMQGTEGRRRKQRRKKDRSSTTDSGAAGTGALSKRREAATVQRADRPAVGTATRRLLDPDKVRH
jgi:hypothetical protein